MFVFSPVFGKMLTKLGRKKVLVIGCLCEGTAMICFGFLDYMEDPIAYATLSFLCRFVEGFGNGCLNSGASSIIADEFEDNMGNLMGLTQTFTGLGMLSGPILGSLLFEAGGFKIPFFVTGSLLFLLIVPVMAFITQKPAVEIRESQILNGAFFNILSHFKIIMIAISMSTSLLCLTFKEPLFQIRL